MFTWCSSGDSCVQWPLRGATFLLCIAPPWPNGSSSSLHLSVCAVGTCKVGVSTHRSSRRVRIAVHVVGSSFQLWRPPALPHLAHRYVSRLLHLLIACSTDAKVSNNSFHFCCLVFLWGGVRGGRNSRLGWPEKAARFASIIRILTCQAIRSIAWTALAWLGRTSTLVAVLPAISSANVLPRTSNSVERPISSSFAARWILHTSVTRTIHRGLLSRASKNRRHKSPLVPRFALVGFVMEVRRYWASSLTS